MTSRVALVCGCYGFVAGATTLMGWVGGWPRLTDWFGMDIAMLPNTAAAAIAAGMALCLASFGRWGWSAALAAIVAMIGALTLFEHLTGVNLGIDTILHESAWGLTASTSRGRMGPPAAMSYTLIGVGLIAARGGGWARNAAALCGIVVAGIGTLSIVGYLYGASVLYSVPRWTGIALQTSSVVGALGLGVFAVSRVRSAVARGAGAAPGATFMPRWVVVFVVLLPVGVGWLGIVGQRAELYDSAFGSALRTLVEMALLGVAVWWAWRTIGGKERALRAAQAELIRQSGQLRAFLETAAIGLHREGPDGTILWANDAELELLGYSREEYVGRNIAEFHADAGVISDILERLHRGERLRDVETQMKCKDGSLKSVLIDLSVLWEDGRFVHTQCFTRDISEQRRAAQWLRNMIEALPNPVYTTDAEGRITHFNRAAVEFVGRTPAVGVDRWCVTWKLHDADGTFLPHDQSPMATALREGRPIRCTEGIAERPDGTRRWIEGYPTPMFDSAGRVIGGVNMLVDITDRKQSEVSSIRLASIVESSGDAIISKNLDGVIATWNHGAEKTFGYTETEAVGRNIRFLIPEDRQAEETEVLARLGRGEKIEHFETVRQTKDGRLIDVSLTVSPLRDRSGRIIGASKIARDITDRKRAEAVLAAYKQELEKQVEERTGELVAAHERLRLSDRMAVVGTLASGLAHDMKNVLFPLGLRLDTILTTKGLPREAARDLAVV
ncbi:MAG TPA: PAS domain S-box protein, partial [Phycisphaerales bacterium]|nr:PAS domain S-box protein [Phycisphaerales bacterium]